MITDSSNFGMWTISDFELKSLVILSFKNKSTKLNEEQKTGKGPFVWNVYLPETPNGKCQTCKTPITPPMCVYLHCQPKLNKNIAESKVHK